MENIANIELLHGMLSEEQLTRLEESAQMHQRYSNISFKILEHTEGRELLVSVRQGEHLSENYADNKRLLTLGKELFGPLLPEGIKLHVYPSVYTKSPFMYINIDWLRSEMSEAKISSREIQEETGVDKGILRKLLSGEKQLNNVLRAMFHFYFLSRKQRDKPS